jgi:hypothetical protein
MKSYLMFFAGVVASVIALQLLRNNVAFVDNSLKSLGV